MKVGIMSMQRIENYGSFLQSYGLKKILEEMGHEVYFVDYEIGASVIEKVDEPIQRYTIPYKIKRRLNYYINTIQKKLNGELDKERFLEENCIRNMYKYYLMDLGITEDRTQNVPVDVLIIGSDEVFNCLQENPAVGYSPQLFGEGIKANKVISYAASAGYTTIEGLKKYDKLDDVKRMLNNNFSAISVRDENTRILVNELTGLNPYMHLDPVLISDFESDIIEKKDISDYLVVYSYEKRMENNQDEAKAIQDFAHNRGLKTVSIGNFQSWTDLHISASPFELLGYIKNADFVVTDTFHGTIFSIILEKHFATIIRDSNNQKLESLLNTFNLHNHELKDLDQLDVVLNQQSDWIYVENLRGSEKKEALNI